METHCEVLACLLLKQSHHQACLNALSFCHNGQAFRGFAHLLQSINLRILHNTALLSNPVSTSAPCSGPNYWLACWLHSTPSSELSSAFIDSSAVSLNLFLCAVFIYHHFLLTVMLCLSHFILFTTINPSHLSWLISGNVAFSIHCCKKCNLPVCKLRSASFLLGQDGWYQTKVKECPESIRLTRVADLLWPGQVDGAWE